MPKVIDYPRASFKRAIELAQAVDNLGGEATPESAAESLGLKGGGSFQALVSATVKYGFLAAKGGKLQVTPTFKHSLLAYSPEEKRMAELKAFLSVPLFRDVAARFIGKKLPDYFDKLLVREFGVPAEMASRVSGYFIEGARLTGVVDDGGVVVVRAAGSATETDAPAAPDEVQTASREPEQTSLPTAKNDKYRVRITGPDMDSTMEINDVDDLEIVEVMIKKVRRLIMTKQ